MGGKYGRSYQERQLQRPSEVRDDSGSYGTRALFSRGEATVPSIDTRVMKDWTAIIDFQGKLSGLNWQNFGSGACPIWQWNKFHSLLSCAERLGEIGLGQ